MKYDGTSVAAISSADGPGGSSGFQGVSPAADWAT